MWVMCLLCFGSLEKFFSYLYYSTGKVRVYKVLYKVFYIPKYSR